MKIVNVVDIFHPDAGYENNVLSKYFVKFGHKYIILTTDLEDGSGFLQYEDIEEKDNAFMQQTGVKVIRLHAKGLISGRAIWKYNEFEKTLRSIEPDVVFFCGNDTLIAMQYLLQFRKNLYTVVTDSHMLEMATQNRLAKLYRIFYKTVITPIIIKHKIPVIRVQDDSYVEKCLGIPLTQAPWISFGTDVDLFRPDVKRRQQLRARYNIDEEDFVFICTGKLTEEKGGMLLAEAFREKLVIDKNIVLVTVGSTSGEYGKQVDETLAKSENRVLRFPTQKYYELPKYYQMADVCVFAKQCSLSFYDAQGCGLPVLSEDNNINAYRNSHANGWTFKSGDISDFRNKITMIASLPEEERKRFSANAYSFITENYNYEDKAREYEALMLREMKRQGESVL